MPVAQTGHKTVWRSGRNRITHIKQANSGGQQVEMRSDACLAPDLSILLFSEPVKRMPEVSNPPRIGPSTGVLHCGNTLRSEGQAAMITSLLRVAFPSWKVNANDESSMNSPHSQFFAFGEARSTVSHLPRWNTAQGSLEETTCRLRAKNTSRATHGFCACCFWQAFARTHSRTRAESSLP